MTFDLYNWNLIISSLSSNDNFPKDRLEVSCSRGQKHLDFDLPNLTLGRILFSFFHQTY